jgi:hypothetical protein
MRAKIGVTGQHVSGYEFVPRHASVTQQKQRCMLFVLASLA